MNLLLVDDEKLAIEVIRKTIPMAKYGIEEIYTAYSMKQAVEVLESHSVSIIICDIQMPKGSGLDLAAWIREQGLKVEIIFLTSYALFSYAQEAIKLNAHAYLLKPVKRQELENAISSTVEKIEADRMTEQNRKYAEYWNSSQVALQQDFWRRCFSQDMKESMEHIRSRAKKAGVAIGGDTSCYPILLEWKKKPQMGSLWSSETLSFTVRNIVSETLFQETEIGNVVEAQKEGALIFYPVREETELLIQEKCRMMLESCQDYLKFCSFTIYVKEIVPLTRLKETVEYICKAAKEDAVKKEGVVWLNRKKEKVSYVKPEMNTWVQGIFDGQVQETTEKIGEFLGQMGRGDELDTNVLRCIQQDFLQDLYIEMGRHGMRANIVFRDEQMRRSFAEACLSIDSFLLWVSLTGKLLHSYGSGSGKTSSIIRQVRQYIEEHAGEEISRKELAAKVYLHPDYMNRLFKEQVGTSVSDYVIQVRLNWAKELLCTTEDSISSVAAKVGYPNTAYFTKIFKRSTGVTPKEYRKAQEAL